MHYFRHIRPEILRTICIPDVHVVLGFCQVKIISLSTHYALIHFPLSAHEPISISYLPFADTVESQIVILITTLC